MNGEKSNWIETYAENLYYEDIIEQIKNDPLVDFGGDVNVLIISDRCPGRSKGLCEYLRAKTKFSNITLVQTLSEAQESITGVCPDILVFTGAQEDKTNYQIISVALQENPYILIVMFAALDNYIRDCCLKYRIPYMFSSKKPISAFISYLKEVYESNKQSVYSDMELIKRSMNEAVPEPIKQNSIFGWIAKQVRKLKNKINK
jgi:hypothetical protein